MKGIVFLANRNSGCYAYMGMVGGRQQLSLGQGCVTHGTIQHEFMHALGLGHEQARHDRDSYITVNLNNVQVSLASSF